MRRAWAWVMVVLMGSMVPVPAVALTAEEEALRKRAEGLAGGPQELEAILGRMRYVLERDFRPGMTARQGEIIVVVDNLTAPTRYQVYMPDQSGKLNRVELPNAPQGR